MTINAIVKELCKREGKKKQVDVAQMSETVGHLSDMLKENFEKNNLRPDTTATSFIDIVLYNNGVKRAAKQAKKKG